MGVVEMHGEEAEIDRPVLLTGRHLHLHVRVRIEQALGGRPWKWLAEAAGIPQSTLSTQVNRSKFSLETLVRIAAALEEDIGFFLPEGGGYGTGSSRERWLTEQLEILLRDAHRRLGPKQPIPPIKREA